MLVTMRPVVFLLCGLPGSGKTTYAKELERSGAVRLTLDEELFARFGREYANHAEKQDRTRDELKNLMTESLAMGNSVILDFGFWKKADRDEYKMLIEKSGGECRLLYFKADKDTLMSRLASRNLDDSDNNHIIDESLLEKFIAEFEEPRDEAETVVEQQ